MSHSKPTNILDLISQTLTQVVIAGFLLPVMQIALLEILDAMPEGSLDATGLAIIYAALVTFALFPFITTIGAILVAYGIADAPGVALYVFVGVIFSLYLGVPRVSATILFVALCMGTIWIWSQNRSRGRGPRPY